MTAVLESIIEQKNKEAEMLRNTKKKIEEIENKSLKDYTCEDSGYVSNEAQVHFIDEYVNLQFGYHVKNNLELKDDDQYLVQHNLLQDRYITDKALDLFFVFLKSTKDHGVNIFEKNVLRKIFIDWLEYFSIHSYTKNDLYYRASVLEEIPFRPVERIEKITNKPLEIVYGCADIFDAIRSATEYIRIHDECDVDQDTEFPGSWDICLLYNYCAHAQTDFGIVSASNY